MVEKHKLPFYRNLNNSMWLIILMRNCCIRSQWCEYFMRAITPVHFLLPNISHSSAGRGMRSYFCAGGQGRNIASAQVCRGLSGDIPGFICNTVFPFEFLTFDSGVLLSRGRSSRVSGTPHRLPFAVIYNGDEVAKGRRERNARSE